jgi:cyanobactin maturation PatA/PatG family protease
METEPEVEEMEALELSPDALEVSAGGAVAPSDCHCGKGGTATPCGCKKGSASSPVPGSRTLVYALGVIGYDFGSEARRDSFIQEGLAHPGSPEELLAHLDANPASAAAIKWTLAQDSTVLYAIAPAGPFAALAYERLREFLAEQLKSGVEQVSIPGRLAGKSILQNGQAVPTILPELRGMYSWTTGKLVEAVSGTETGATADDVRNFLQRVYYETRNLGLAPQERALNFAATNAFQVERVFTTTLGSGLKLDTISVERSPVCRPSSDCWDVKLSFFNPLRRLEQARQVHRFTIDVSDVIPVTVGAIRSWDVY